jgi:hypothetical protein
MWIVVEIWSEKHFSRIVMLSRVLFESEFYYSFVCNWIFSLHYHEHI